MIKSLITSVLAFASTNIDDIFILMLFFSNRKTKPEIIIAGQYLGIGALVVLSFIGAYVGNFFDQRYVGVLGLFPVYLSIRQIINLIKKKDAEENPVEIKGTDIIAIAGVTIANGGDNIGVYVPLLTTMTFVEKILMITVFIMMTYVWCQLAKYLSEHPLIAGRLEKYGHIIMPIVLFLLGIFILIENDSFTLLLAN